MKKFTNIKESDEIAADVRFNEICDKVLLDLEVLLYCKILKKLDDNEDVLITKGELARLQIRDNWSKEYIKRKEEERKFSCSVQMVGFD
jgi:hypothetical protein